MEVPPNFLTIYCLDKSIKSNLYFRIFDSTPNKSGGQKIPSRRSEDFTDRIAADVDLPRYP